MASTRPEIAVGEWDWRVNSQARRDDVDWEVFFEPSGREAGSARRRREATAKSLCNSCPVIWQCRDHALQFEEKHGIWGGMAVAELGGRGLKRSA